MGYIALIVAIVVVVWIFYLARPAVIFVIHYKDGRKTVRGDIRPAVLTAIDDICRQHGVVSGTIKAVPAGKLYRLKFSNDIPQGCQQQIRNMLLSGAYNDLRLAPPR